MIVERFMAKTSLFKHKFIACWIFCLMNKGFVIFVIQTSFLDHLVRTQNVPKNYHFLPPDTYTKRT